MIWLIGVDWLMNDFDEKRKKYNFVKMTETRMMRRIELEIVDDLVKVDDFSKMVVPPSCFGIFVTSKVIH